MSTAASFVRTKTGGSPMNMDRWTGSGHPKQWSATQQRNDLRIYTKGTNLNRSQTTQLHLQSHKILVHKIFLIVLYKIPGTQTNV